MIRISGVSGKTGVSGHRWLIFPFGISHVDVNSICFFVLFFFNIKWAYALQFAPVPTIPCVSPGPPELSVLQSYRKFSLYPYFYQKI